MKVLKLAVFQTQNSSPLSNLEAPHDPERRERGRCGARRGLQRIGRSTKQAEDGLENTSNEQRLARFACRLALCLTFLLTIAEPLPAPPAPCAHFSYGKVWNSVAIRLGSPVEYPARSSR
jgi:hypothetical protein